jgi:oleate hydratase
MASKTKAYLIGGWIGSLAAAAFVVRDAAMPGENIFAFKTLNKLGGGLDAAGNSVTGYSMRGARMFTFENYE